MYLWLILIFQLLLDTIIPMLSAARLCLSVPAFPWTCFLERSWAVARGVVKTALSVLVSWVAQLHGSSVGSCFLSPVSCSFGSFPCSTRLWRKGSWEFSFWRPYQSGCLWTSRIEVLPQRLRSMFPLLSCFWYYCCDGLVLLSASLLVTCLGLKTHILHFREGSFESFHGNL